MKIGDTLYFDHQATTPIDSRVLDAMRPYFEESFGNPHAVDHVAGWRAAQAVSVAVERVASLIGSDPDEVVFTSGATEANNLALLGLCRRAMGSQRNRIFLGATEHKCILELGRVLQDVHGYEITHIPVDSGGRIDLDVIADTISDDVLLVSVMAVNNEIGTIQDIEAISRIVQRHGALLHCDAAQAPCALNLSHLAQTTDMLSLSGHKMYGPMGVGALYVSRSLHRKLDPIIYGGGQQNGLRSGTLPTPLCVGFGVAAELAGGPDAENERIALSEIRGAFAQRLEKLRCRTWFNGPSDPTLCHPGNLSVGFEGIVATDLLSRVQPRLAASTGSACTSGIIEPSHVLRAIGLSGCEAESTIRFSLGRYSSTEHVEEAFEIIAEAVGEIIDDGLLQSA